MSASASPLVVGLGEILWDLLPTGKCLGGAPANFAFHAGQLGARGIAVSAIGDDPLGEEIVATLEGLGLSTAFLQRVAAPTGTVTVAVKDGQPDYTIHTGVAWDTIPFDTELAALAREADVVCFGSLAQRSPVSKATIQSFLAATRRDCLRLFDINLRQRYFDAETIVAGLEVAEAVKLNDEELPTVAQLLGLPKGEEEAIAALLSRFSPRLIALTRGAHGSSLISRYRRSDHPGHPTTVADTVGAGDAFTAALALGLLRFDDLDALHERASRLASFVCSQPGATPRHQ